MSYSAATTSGSFLIQNTYYNVKPLPGLPTNNLSVFNSNTGGLAPASYTGNNLYPQSTATPLAMSDFMQLSNVIQGFEKGFQGYVQGPN